MVDDKGTPVARKAKSSRRTRAGTTISDVAQHAGVSLMTVSRVINGKSNVRPETREIVTASIKALHYSPSAAARNLAAASEMRIGLLYSNPSAGYLNEFLVGALDQAGRYGAQLVVETCDPDGNRLAIVEQFIRKGIDGIIVPAPLGDAHDILALIADNALPCVTVASGDPLDTVSSVNIDDRSAARAMTEHLVGLGHRRIGLIAGNPNQTASALRRQGYFDALEQAGIAADPALVVGGLFTYRSGLDAARDLIELPDRPTAIFASNDDMAVAAISVAHRLGLDVPGDLTVVGYDDAPQATTIWPELTTIRQPIADMSKVAIDLLVEEIQARRSDGDVAPRHVQMDFTLVTRSSAGSPQDR